MAKKWKDGYTYQLKSAKVGEFIAYSDDNHRIFELIGYNQFSVYNIQDDAALSMIPYDDSGIMKNFEHVFLSAGCRKFFKRVG